jgi:hypothetical protein
VFQHSRHCQQRNDSGGAQNSPMTPSATILTNSQAFCFHRWTSRNKSWSEALVDRLRFCGDSLNFCRRERNS